MPGNATWYDSFVPLYVMNRNTKSAAESTQQIASSTPCRRRLAIARSLVRIRIEREPRRPLAPRDVRCGQDIVENAVVPVLPPPGAPQVARRSAHERPRSARRALPSAAP